MRQMSYALLLDIEQSEMLRLIIHIRQRQHSDATGLLLRLLLPRLLLPTLFSVVFFRLIFRCSSTYTLRYLLPTPFLSLRVRVRDIMAAEDAFHHRLIFSARASFSIASLFQYHALLFV